MLVPERGEPTMNMGPVSAFSVGDFCLLRVRTEVRVERFIRGE